MAIDRVKIRAKISIGNTFYVQTPYILSFNVSVARGQVSTFSASIKVSHEDIRSGITGSTIKIEAGEGSPETTIFQGIVRKATISPVFDDPKYVVISLSGEDNLSLLRNKKYTRRCRSTLSTYCTIDDVVRAGLRSSKFKARKTDSIEVKSTEVSEEPNKAVSVGLGTDILKVTNSARGYGNTAIVAADAQTVNPEDQATE
jgi:hypothetical protein